MTQHTLIDATAEAVATTPQPGSRRDQAAALRDRVRDQYVDSTKSHPGVVFLTEVNAPH